MLVDVAAGGNGEGGEHRLNYLFEWGEREDTKYNIEMKAVIVAAGILFDLQLSHDE